MLFRLFASALCALLVSPAIARPVDYPQSLARRAASQTHRVVTYMAYYHVDQNTGPYTPLLPIVDDHSNITDVVLFSVDLHTNQPNLTIGGVAPDNSTFLGPLWSEVTKIQAGGIKVLASLGGYGSDSFILLENDFDGYYALLKQFLQYYKLDGLDIDVEPSTDSTYSGTPSGASIVKLLKQVDQDFGSDFLVTMVPVADDLAANPPDYSGFDYKTVDNEAKDADGNHIIDWFNGQFYSGFGDCGDTTTYDQIIQNGYSPERVVMLVPSNQQDAQPWCNISVVESVASQLTRKYDNFGGMGGYDYTFAGSSDNITRIQWYQDVGQAITRASA